MEILTKVIAWCFCGYAIWHLLTNQMKISASNKAAKHKLDSFEASLEKDISAYTVYTNGHPYNWSEYSYEKLCKKVLNSAGWSLVIPWWHEASSFVTKVDESRKMIYFIVGHNDFEWGSLKHYDEWLDSNKKVSKNIAKYKSS